MTEDIKVPAAPDASDKVKLTLGCLLVVAGIVAFYLLNQAAWVRWIAVAAGLALGCLVVGASRYGSALKQFVLDSRVELRKVVWPTRNETGMTTLVVFVFVAVSGLFFWLLDFVLAWATRAFTGQGG